MNPRMLVMTGLGLLLLGLLLVLGMSNPLTNVSQQAVTVQSYASHACATTGTGLIIVAALVSALRRPEKVHPTPLDHYS